MTGIYIHIPFCKQQCSYCDFHFSTTFESYRERMINAICRELELRAETWNQEQVSTIYFGGGTPSLINENELNQILKTCRNNYRLTNEVEYTLECNPDDCSEDKLAAWKAAGINRLSIGIQALQNGQLQWMNRTHGSNEGLEAVHRAAKAGFDNITVDLMYGLPELTREEWIGNIETIAQLPVQHVSAYCLTVEDRTPLAAWVKKGEISTSSNEEQSEQFQLLVAVLAKHGFEQYEISNFAKNEQYSKHNTAYWQGVKFAGIGPSAHGYDGVSRYWNVANNVRYMKAMELGTPDDEWEELSKYDRFNELLMVGLRTKWGVSLTELAALLPLEDEWILQIEELLKEKDAVIEDNRLILTLQGKLRADAIASDLFQLSN